MKIQSCGLREFGRKLHLKWLEIRSGCQEGKEKIVGNTLPLKQSTKDALCFNLRVQKEDVRHSAINSGLQENMQ